MNSSHRPEKRFASFILDGDPPIEFAIHAEEVLEATPVTGAIQPMPAGVPYLEGFMHLRDDAIPVVNMKKRLGMPRSEYAPDAKVAVVTISQIRLGLLFDDINDVFVVRKDCIENVPGVFQNGDGIISHLVKLAAGRRTLELVDLRRIFGDGAERDQVMDAAPSRRAAGTTSRQSSSRFVVFDSAGQEYGVPVKQVQEITFLSEIDDVFKNGSIEGAVQLRGHSIPVIHAGRLLQTQPQSDDSTEDTRVLILNADNFQYGLIVDEVKEILPIVDDTIMALPCDGHDTIHGIYQRQSGENIMLIQVDRLIDAQQRELRAMARLKSSTDEDQEFEGQSHTRHLITDACYLVFSIGRNFAIELNDVQEIIEPRDLMALPTADGVDRRVLNLRGSVIPVINLSYFYGYGLNDSDAHKKLIIARCQDRIVALEVDHILTIYKQVEYQNTPSLNPQLSDKRDTLDRLIEFVNESGIKEHVLVVNVEALMTNHLGMPGSTTASVTINDVKESSHADHSPAQ